MIHQRKNVRYAFLACLLAFVGTAGIFFWQKGHRLPLEGLSIIENEAFEIPVGGGTTRFIQDTELKLQPQKRGSHADLVLIDAVPAGDTLLSESGWRIPAFLGSKPFSIPVSIKSQSGVKLLEFQIHDLPILGGLDDSSDNSIKFSYETGSSLGGLRRLADIRYDYSPKAIPFGRPVKVSLTLNVEDIHGLEDPGMAFFFRNDLTDADIEVTSAPETLLDLSTNAAQLFMGEVDKGSLVHLELRMAARRQGPIRLDRAIIVGGYLKDPPYPGIKVKGAKVTERALSATVSFLGDMVFQVEGQGH